MKHWKHVLTVLCAVCIILYTNVDLGNAKTRNHSLSQTWLESHALSESGTVKEPDMIAQAAVLMDGDTGRILYGKNEEHVLPMASTTKIMTCILALEHTEPDDIVTVSPYAASMPDVQLNIREGEQYRMYDLLHSLMLESHNDTAVAIAEHVGGSVHAFAERMNQKAKEIGCTDTCFITPNGLDGMDQENGKMHSTSAVDLARIMRYCILQSPKKEEFLEITRAPSHAFSDIKRTRNYSCINHNALLTMMNGAISGKTGFTNAAGYCYVGAVEQDGKTFVAALLACGWPPHKTYKWQDMRKLITYGNDAYDYYEILGEKLTPEPVAVENGIEETVPVEVCYPPDGSLHVLMREDEPVTVIKKMKQTLKAPVEKGREAGRIIYCVGETPVAEYPVIAAEYVGLWNMEFCAKTLLNRFLFCYNPE